MSTVKDPSSIREALNFKELDFETLL